MKKLFTILFLLFSIAVYAVSGDTVIYYKSNNSPVSTKENAKYYIVFKASENGLMHYKRYCMDDKLQEEGTVQNSYTLVKEGKITTFYENGKVKDETDYIAGLPNGIQTHYFESGKMNYKIAVTSSGYGFGNQKEKVAYLFCADADGKTLLTDGTGQFRAYDDQLNLIQEGAVLNSKGDGVWSGYDNGKPYYKETYKNGRLIKGESYCTGGKTYTYTKTSKRPEPKGGIHNFYEYIASSIAEKAIQQSAALTGNLLVKFTVTESGELNDISVLKSANAKIDKLAVEALMNSPKWSPALAKGQAKPMAYYMPITLK